ncbi:MAG TPA: hypothetical protein DFR83_02035 [Deltaproteobacteria bacterium]|nr:hypothetical protein [Deltaproteobacteria bacterium]
MPPLPVLSDRPLADAGLRTFDRSLLASLEHQEVHPGLFEVDLLTPAAAARVRAELQAARDWCIQTGCVPPPPNSMHEAGADTHLLGLDQWASGLASDVLAELAHRLLPDHAPQPPPDVHAFSVDYGPSGDTDLAQHVDDAQVTVNLWLGGDAADSAVVFEGVRCLMHLDIPLHRTEEFAWRGRPGVALVHAGLHRHRTRAVGAGQRDSLIFWLQDPVVRAARFEDAQQAQCPDWCGIHDAP